MLCFVQLAELLAVQESGAEVENLREVLNTERRKVRALELALEAAREQDHHYAANAMEEIERGECGRKIIICIQALNTSLSLHINLLIE
jgi:hypothetical protein